MKSITYILTIFILAGFACNVQQEKETNYTFEKEDLAYARGFTIESGEKIKLITVFNPWQGANSIKYKYALIDRDAGPVKLGKDWIVIKTPVERVVCLSTTHIAFLDVINETSTIVGISGINYVNHPELQKRIANQEIPDVGYDNNLNYELIASLKPDLVITYGVGSQVAGYNQKLNDLGIKTIINAEYLENHPLGKLEWIKFMAALYHKDQEAKQYFDKTTIEYNALINLAENVHEKPRVLFGLPWKEAWYVPGGNSYLATMVEHAGGNYLWKHNESRESLPFNIESMFAQAADAQIWLNIGTVSSKDDILKTDDRFKEFKPFNESKLYNNNKLINKFGGNDYWESGLTKPHIILKDMIKIFHPELLPDHELVYYTRIE